MPEKPTYNFICFTDLLNEYDLSQQPVVEKKIKRRLRYYNLGAYDALRVEKIRSLKNELVAEINLHDRSRYYKKNEALYAALKDFNVDKMVSDYRQKYPEIEQSEMHAFINLAVYHFHLR